MKSAKCARWAAAFGLPSAQKDDSMSSASCRTATSPPGSSGAAARGAGALIYGGRVVGEHRGIHRYTLGQRRGLGFAAGRRVFVSDIDPLRNSVTLADGDGLYEREVTALDARWQLDAVPDGPFRCLARIRHSRSPRSPSAARRALDWASPSTRPQRAPTPGQAAAVYLPDGRLAAGGVIARGAGT